MTDIGKEFEKILKPISISINEIHNIDFGDLSNSFDIAKQKVGDLICKTTMQLPIPKSRQDNYIEHIIFMFNEKKYYSPDNTPTRGIHSYGLLRYIIERYIEFIKSVLYDFSNNVSNSIQGSDKNEIISLMNRFIDELENLKELKKLGIINENEENPFDDYKDYVFNKLLKKINNSESSPTEIEKHDKTQLQGFKSPLNPIQIETLFVQLKGNYIAENTKPDHFKAIFINEPLPPEFEKVKWIYSSRTNKPHKTALREFLKIAFGKVPSQKAIDVYISDKKGNPIKLAKPKKEANTEYWTDIFKKMIK